MCEVIHSIMNVNVLCKLKVITLSDEGNEELEEDANSQVSETVMATYDDVRSWKLN